MTFEAKAKDFKICPRGRPRGQGRPQGLHLCALVHRLYESLLQTDFTKIFTKIAKSKLELFNEHLNTVDITNILTQVDPNKALNLLSKMYISAFDHHFVLKRKNLNRTNQNWFDSELEKLLRKKDKLCKRYISDKTIENKNSYKNVRNLYFHTLSRKKHEHNQQKFQALRQNLKATWKMLNNIMGRIKQNHCKVQHLHFPFSIF